MNEANPFVNAQNVSTEEFNPAEIDQNVVSEDDSSRKLMTIGLIIIVPYLIICFFLTKIQYYNSYAPVSYNVSTNEEKRKISFATSFANISKSAECAILCLQILQEPKASVKPATVKLDVHSSVKDLSNSTIKYGESQLFRRYPINDTYLPILYQNLHNVISLDVSVDAEVHRDWFYQANFYWLVGLKPAYELSLKVHGASFVLLAALTAFWFSMSRKKLSVRSRFISFLLPIACLSEIPLEYVSPLSFDSADTIRSAIGSLYFCCAFFFWRLKSVGFDVKKITSSSESRSLIIVGAMGIYQFYDSINKYLLHSSLPASPSGSSMDEGDFISQNVGSILVVAAFYYLFIEVIDRMDKLDGEDASHFSADNFLIMFAALFNSINFLRRPKVSKIIEDPIMRQLLSALWVLPTVYEVYASAPSDVLASDDENRFIPDIDETIQQNSEG